MPSADNLYSLDPEQAQKILGPIWIQTVQHSDGIPERIFRNDDFEKNQQTTKKHEKNTQHAMS